MEGELIPADVVIDFMTLWSREVEDHPEELAILQGSNRTIGGAQRQMVDRYFNTASAITGDAITGDA